MIKIKDILRLHLLGRVTSCRRIRRAVGFGKTAVAECLRRATAAGQTDWAAVDALDEAALEARLYPPVVRVGGASHGPAAAGLEPDP